MSPEWLNSFPQFLEDMGRRPEGHTLDRIDVDGDYEAGNCRWATPREQGNNTRKNVIVELSDGRTMTLKEAARELGVNYTRLHEIFRYKGLSLYDAVNYVHSHAR